MLLENEYKIIEAKKSEIERADIKKSPVPKETLVLKDGDMDSFLGKYMSREELSKLKRAMEEDED